MSNGRIVCSVTNCVYHKGSGECGARMIAIGPNHAVSSTDTVCATFKPKNR